MGYDKTEETLGVYWDFENGTKEVDGMPFLACWYNYVPKDMRILTDELKEMFEARIFYPSHLEEKEDFDYEGKGKLIQVCFDIKVNKWPLPDKWRETVKKICENIMKYEPIVVYAIRTEIYNDPPDIFAPDMRGHVWTAFTDKGDFYLHSELMEEYSPLTREELKELDTYTRRRMKEIEEKGKRDEDEK